MSTTGVSNPAFYSYPSSLPAGIESSTSTSSTGGSSSSTKTSPYEAAYANLQQYDAQELFQVTFGTPEAAQANIASVLSQWAAIQDGQNAARRQSVLNEANNAIQGTPPATSSFTAPAVPSLTDVIGQSDQTANAVLSKYASAPPGSSIVDYQA
ncbi:MAG: hypothetical protein JO359_15095 [Candidatus Eremiobacteraeota bacterium]|nr:hypothetical protein [Candidatus Eremiobacteraeota bacterium]